MSEAALLAAVTLWVVVMVRAVAPERLTTQKPFSCDVCAASWVALAICLLFELIHLSGHRGYARFGLLQVIGAAGLCWWFLQWRRGPELVAPLVLPHPDEK